MPALRSRIAFRRLALSLAAAQLLAYAAAPALEAVGERSPGPVAIEAAHSKACAPIHQPATCLACQMLSMNAQCPAGTSLPSFGSERAASVDLVASAAAPRAPPLRFLSRAPPLTLG
jgi:hypothetical protein